MPERDDRKMDHFCRETIHSSSPTRSTPPDRCLWKHSSKAPRRPLDSYDTIYQQATRTPARYKSYFWLCANTLVILQQVSWTVWFWCRHQLHQSNQLLIPRQATWMEYSNFCLLLTLMLSLLFNIRSDPTQNRRRKAVHRTTDGIVLGVVLRFLSSVLQHLTNSYSSDTVDTLVVALLVVHVVFCDYSYANGRTLATGPPRVSTAIRPAFFGGTLSLNAVLFATTLLVSRQTDILQSYLFMSAAVVIFGFYPLTRHTIAAQFPASTSGPLWCITASIVASTVCLLQILDAWYLYAYSGTLLTLGLILPAWKYRLQYSKVLIQGPWEIPTAASMQLDYTE